MGPSRSCCDLQELFRRVQAAGPGRRQSGDLAWKPWIHTKAKGKPPPVLRRPGFSPVGFKAQHEATLARELLGRFIPWPFYSTHDSSSASSFLMFFYVVVFGAIPTPAHKAELSKTLCM